MDSAVLLETSSILKNKLPNPVKKSNVHFEGDPIIIGYCDDDSGNEEEPESNYSSSEDQEDNFTDEDDCEFSKLTESNTKFNSISSNLRQVSNRFNKGLIKSEAKLNGDLLQAHLKSSLDNFSGANDMVTTTSNSNLESTFCLNHVDSNNDDKATEPMLISSSLVKDGDFKSDDNGSDKTQTVNGHFKKENEFQKLHLIKESSKSSQVFSNLDDAKNKNLSESVVEVHPKPIKPERINRGYKSLSLINSKGFNKVLEINHIGDDNKAVTGSLHYNKKQRSLSQDLTKSVQDLGQRELRLAELAQELELVRNHPKRPAPLPPCFQQNYKDYKFSSISRIKLPPPPRPPSITSMGKFSIKKLLKFNKYGHTPQDSVNDTVSSAKAWKTNGFEFDRNKIEIIHPAHLNNSQSYSGHKLPTPPSSSSSFSSSSASSQSSKFSEDETSDNSLKEDTFKPNVPLRKNKILSSSSANNYARCSLPAISSLFLNPRDLITSSTRLPPSPPPSPPSPVPLSTLASSYYILSELTLENAYLRITKFNFDTINKMLLDYSIGNQMPIKSCSMKEIIYKSSHILSPSVKLFKTSILRSEGITANLLVTPRTYIARLESFQDFLIGQYIDEESKIFAISSDFETFYTMDKLISATVESQITLNLKQSLIILLQLIDLFQAFQTNGLEEIKESKLKEIVICINSKSTTSIHVIYPSFEFSSPTTSFARASSVTSSNTHFDASCSSSSSSSSSCQPSPTYNFSETITLVLKCLESQTNERETLSTIRKILEEDDTSINLLIKAKIIFEIILFQVPLNFDNQSTLSIWFDIQRSKLINVLNYQLDSNCNPKRSIYNYYYLLFITRSNFKLLFQALQKLKLKSLH